MTNGDTAREATLEILDYSSSALYEFSQGSLQRKKEIAGSLAESYLLTGPALQVKLHPLLEPLINRSIEPPKPPSGTRNGICREPSVPLSALGGNRTPGLLVRSQPL